MNPQRAFIRKVVYLVAIGVLLGPLFWLSHPATSDVKEAKGRPGGKLAQLRDQYHLSQTQLGQVDLTSETIKLSTLGMRGVAADVLWAKANKYQMKKDWTRLSATVEQITKVQPNFIGPWKFQAWNLSYNVAAAFDDYHDKYYWVIRGIDFLKEGVQHNEHEPRLLWEIAWYISQKIGKADEKKQFRRLFKEDDAFHGALPLAQRDNWLVGQKWFQKAEDLVDTLGVPVKSMSLLVFFSNAPMCQMNYADALEKDGTFGEVARTAWKEAARQWKVYGDRPLPVSLLPDATVHLNDQEKHEEAAAKMLAQLEALQPGLRAQIAAEKLAKLKPAERAAWKTPAAKRTAKQQSLAAAAEEKLKIAHKEVAMQIRGRKRGQALELAKNIAEHEDWAHSIRGERSIVNFENWRLHADVEQTDKALAARKLVYQGDRAFAQGDLAAASTAYDKGLKAWRDVLDEFPKLKADNTTPDDLMDIIKRYRRILSQLDEPFPKNFILQDIIDLNPSKDVAGKK